MKTIGKDYKLQVDLIKLAKKYHLKSALLIAEDDETCVDGEFHITSSVKDETLSKLIGLLEVAKSFLLKRF